MTIETKYDIGDIVFFRNKNKVQKGTITHISISIDKTTHPFLRITYQGLRSFPKGEHEVFKSKEELIILLQ